MNTSQRSQAPAQISLLFKQQQLKATQEGMAQRTVSETKLQRTWTVVLLFWEFKVRKNKFLLIIKFPIHHLRNYWSISEFSFL